MAKGGHASSAGPALVGIVKAVSGTVTAINASGSACVLQPGSKVYAGDVIQTGDGAVQIEGVKGGTIEIGRDSSVLAATDLFAADTPSTEQVADAASEAERIQAAIAAGMDPTQVAQASAAGNAATDSSMHSTVVVEQNLASGNAGSGFLTKAGNTGDGGALNNSTIAVVQQNTQVGNANAGFNTAGYQTSNSGSPTPPLPSVATNSSSPVPPPKTSDTAAGNDPQPAASASDTATTVGVANVTTNDSGYTKASTQTLTGTAEAGDTVVVKDGDRTLGTVTADDQGHWKLENVQFGDGAHTITATATDAAGNTATATTAQFNVDATPPAASVTINPIAGNDIVNAAEANGTVAVMGSVGGDVRAGDTVTLTVGNVQYTGQVTAGDGGSLGYSIAVSGRDLAGSQSLTASVTTTDAAGNGTTASLSHGYSVDTATTVGVANVTTNDSGYTNAATQTLTGTAEAGDTVVVKDGERTLGTVTADDQGHWKLENVQFGDGAHTITATATDAAGNMATATTAQFNVDATPPAASVTIGTVTADDIVNASEANGTVTVTGSVGGDVQAGDTVTLAVGNAMYQGQVTAGEGGSLGYSIAVSGRDLAGSQSFTASVTTTDAAGNTTTAGVSQGYQVDTGTTVGIANVTTNGSGYTSASTQTLTGTAEAGDTVVVKDGDRTLGTVTTDDQGTWKLENLHFDDGAHVITATATDAAGNTATATTAQFNVDATPPEAPVITNIVDHTGDYSSVTLYGTGEAGGTIALYGREGSTTNGNDTGSWNYVKVGSATVDADGHWSVDISNLPNAPDNDNEFFKATQTDAVGNVSDFSSAVHYWHGTWASAATEAGDDYDIMGAGNDSLAIVADDANNRLVVDGGLGSDVAKFSMKHTDVDSVIRNGDGELVITEKNGDVDVLRNVETVQFSDGAYKLDDGRLYFDFGDEDDKNDNDSFRNNGIGNGVQDAPGASIDTHADAVDGNYTMRAGTNGNDALAAGDGDSFLSGGSGSDKLNGGAGNDLLIGGKGDDILSGGAGNDVLVGGQGGDTLTGGAGADVFKFTTADGKADVVTDFTVAPTGGDVLDLHDLLGSGGVLSFSDAKTDASGNTVVKLNIDVDGGNHAPVQLATITMQGMGTTDVAAILKTLTDNHEIIK